MSQVMDKNSIPGNSLPDPTRSLGDRIRYHGARVFLLVSLAVAITLFFPPTEASDSRIPPQGSVAQEDVIAEIGFSVPKNVSELERDWQLAMQAVPPTFQYLEGTGESVAGRLGAFFEQLDSAVSAIDSVNFEEILRNSQIAATPSQMEYIYNDEARSVFRAASMRAALEIIPQGVADPARLVDLTTESVTIRRGDQEVSVSAESVITSADFYTEAVTFLPPELPPEAQELFRLVLIYHLDNSLQLDVVETERDRDAARESVPLTKEEVLESQVIVRTGDPIGPDTQERLDAHFEALRMLEDGDPAILNLSAFVGAGLLNLLLLSIFGLFIFFARPEVYANFRWLTLIVVLTTAYFGTGFAIARWGAPAELLPITFVALPIAVLWDTRMALLLVLLLAALTGTLSPFGSYSTVLVLVVGGAAAAMSVRAVRRRSETWVSIAIIAAAAGLALLAHGMAISRPWIEVGQGAFLFGINATVSAIMAMGFMFIFEKFTGITTDRALLEWADPTRPLLRDLAMEAPGTYAHTISVANLAEAAATRINANSLLCRVGVLYHDVGKKLKPHYFVENQPDGRNPHDKLKPETSASIVLEHVTEGVRLAKDAKVPEIVVDFILEHHGTQRIGFFYEKAREELGDEVDTKRFTYPGPKPRSKETAIVMLADSCESAARAMQEPESDRIRELIDTIVDSKVSDGQLDEAPLTLGEIALIKQQFVNILSGVMHRRIEYPETRHLTDANNGESSEVTVGNKES